MVPLFSVLRANGFNDKFISLIAKCVSTTSFSFLINGSPYGFIKPTRGIRQGDPVSPALFVIMFNLIARLLYRAEAEGLIHGIKVSRNSPSFVNLMFVDGLKFFLQGKST